MVDKLPQVRISGRNTLVFLVVDFSFGSRIVFGLGYHCRSKLFQVVFCEFCRRKRSKHSPKPSAKQRGSWLLSGTADAASVSTKGIPVLETGWDFCRIEMSDVSRSVRSWIRASRIHTITETICALRIVT